MNIGSLIKKHRLNQNVSMNSLAKTANIAQSSISEIESGNRQPTYDILEKIVFALGLSMSEFFSSAEDSEFKISPSYNRIAKYAEEKEIPAEILEETILLIEKIINKYN